MVASQRPPRTRTTNADLAGDFQELHGCLHQVGGVAQKALEGVVDLGERVSKVEGILQGMQIQQNSIARSVGAATTPAADDTQEPKGHRRFGGLKQWQAYAGIAASVVTACGIYRVAEPIAVAAGPLLWKAVTSGAQAAHVALMHL